MLQINQLLQTWVHLLFWINNYLLLVSELLKNDGMTYIGDPDNNSGTCQTEHSWAKYFDNHVW